MENVNEAAKAMINEEEIKAAVDGLLAGGTVRDLKGITTAEIETIYRMGYNFYTTGNYKDADTVFRYLVLLDHTNQKYWTALGSVLQVERKFDKAATAFAYAGFLDLTNPKPQFYAAQCFLALGDKSSALSALEALDRYAPKDSPFRAKAAELKAKIGG